MKIEPNNPNPLDDPTSRRLARLGHRRVDTSRLEAKLNAALTGRPAEKHTDSPDKDAAPVYTIRHWLRPVMTAAAAIALAFALFLAMNTGTPQASAAVLELSQLHQDLVAGKIELNTVTSTEEANRWIATQRASAPDLPDHIAGARVQSCCLTDVHGELVAVAVLDDAGLPVTLVVAKAPRFAMEMGTRIEIDGKQFFGHELNGIRMMMANQDDRWLCVMGDRSYDQLARIAAGIEF
ncbi:MAG: hypothetical protein R3C45_05470 [Phycisphaerales bacterium]